MARGTPGFSGADLANLVNEAALLAARKDKRKVTAQDFDDAKDKVLMGNERKSMAMDEKEKYMKEAIRQAKKAAQIGEVPIGCVIVYQGKIIGRGYNRRMVDKNTLSHAELNAIKKASKKLDDWRLDDCELYVTTEPCQMCSGAIVQARIKKVYIGCMNPKAGCAGSIMNLLQVEQFNHQVEIEKGILEEECSNLLKDFFRSLRVKS